MPRAYRRARSRSRPRLLANGKRVMAQAVMFGVGR
jgi:hypothetical protein